MTSATRTRSFSIPVTPSDLDTFREAARVTERSTGKLIVVCARIGAQAILAREARRCECGTVANGQPYDTNGLPEMSAP